MKYLIASMVKYEEKEMNAQVKIKRNSRARDTIGKYVAGKGEEG